jgi:branched-chain amino acid transport system substrate-binding protein
MRIAPTGSIIGAGIAATLLAVGCSSSNSTGSAASATSSSASSVLKSAPAPTLSPINIGFIDPTSGSQPQPGDADAAKAAVYYVNHVLGGIQGHPIDLTTCDTDNTPETNVNCANTFVQADDVAVVDGGDQSSGSELPILHDAKIPLVGDVVQSDPTTNADQKSFYFSSPDQAFSVGPFEILKGTYKSFALTAVDNPPTQGYVNQVLLPAAKQYGIQVKVVYLSDNPDWQAVAASLIGEHADIVGTVGLAESSCTAMLSALRTQAWTGPVFMGDCSDFLTALPSSQSAQTIEYNGIWLPDMAKYAPAVIQQNLSQYAAASKAAGVQPSSAQHPVASFSDVVTLSQIMAKATDPTSGPAVSAAVASAKNFQSFLGPVITCNHKEWPGTSSCTNGFLLLETQSDGALKPITSNGAFQPLTP